MTGIVKSTAKIKPAQAVIVRTVSGKTMTGVIKDKAGGWKRCIFTSF
jgi:hypothetical protein